MMSLSQATIFTGMLLLFVAAPMFLTAEEGENEPVTDCIVWGEPVAGVRCAVSSEPRSGATGSGIEGFRILMLTKNFGDRDVVILSRADVLNIHKLSVLGSDGKPPPVTNKGRLRILKSYDAISLLRAILAPGEETSREFDLREIYKLDRNERYTVSFSRTIFPPDEPARTIISNTLIIRGASKQPVEAPKPK